MLDRRTVSLRNHQRFRGTWITVSLKCLAHQLDSRVKISLVERPISGPSTIIKRTIDEPSRRAESRRRALYLRNGPVERLECVWEQGFKALPVIRQEIILSYSVHHSWGVSDPVCISVDSAVELLVVAINRVKLFGCNLVIAAQSVEHVVDIH